jgi:hypothetical protein
VVFTGASRPLAGSGGIAGCRIINEPTAAGLGAHTITARYYGDRDHRGSHGEVTIAIAATAT